MGTSVTLQPAALHGISMRDSVSGKSAVGEGSCTDYFDNVKPSLRNNSEDIWRAQTKGRQKKVKIFSTGFPCLNGPVNIQISQDSRI